MSGLRKGLHTGLGLAPDFPGRARAVEPSFPNESMPTDIASVFPTSRRVLAEQTGGTVAMRSKDKLLGSVAHRVAVLPHTIVTRLCALLRASGATCAHLSQEPVYFPDGVLARQVVILKHLRREHAALYSLVAKAVASSECVGFPSLEDTMSPPQRLRLSSPKCSSCRVT